MSKPSIGSTLHHRTGLRRPQVLTAILGAALLPAALIGVAHAVDGNTISACVNQSSGVIRKVTGPDDCRSSESSLEWAKQGPAGPAGPTGPAGPAGPAGFVVRQSAPVDVPPEGPIVRDAHVSCRPGERATGGGGLPTGPAPAFYNTVLLASFPTVNGAPAADGATADGWFARARNNGEGNQTMQLIAYVICAPA